MSQEGCSGSVSGVHGDPNRSGICPWCGRKIMPSLPRPALRPHLTEIDEAYGYVYDPDYGSGRASTFKGYKN